MSTTSSDHTSRNDYGGLIDALFDAERVALDLVDLAEAQLLVPADELQFLSRRLRVLVRACITEASKRGVA